jgi:hypothetical protein
VSHSIAGEEQPLFEVVLADCIMSYSIRLISIEQMAPQAKFSNYQLLHIKLLIDCGIYGDRQIHRSNAGYVMIQECNAYGMLSERPPQAASMLRKVR